jgi:hypothetical protein
LEMCDFFKMWLFNQLNNLLGTDGILLFPSFPSTSTYHKKIYKKSDSKCSVCSVGELDF